MGTLTRNAELQTAIYGAAASPHELAARNVDEFLISKIWLGHLFDKNYRNISVS